MYLINILYSLNFTLIDSHWKYSCHNAIIYKCNRPLNIPLLELMDGDKNINEG